MNLISYIQQFKAKMLSHVTGVKLQNVSRKLRYYKKNANKASFDVHKINKSQSILSKTNIVTL